MRARSKEQVEAAPSEDQEADENDRQFVTALARGLEMLGSFEPGYSGSIRS